jgi:hypothetical protein
MVINSDKGMRFYQPPGGGGGGTVNILIQLTAQLQQLNQTIQGLQNLQNTTTTLTQGSAASIGAWSATFEQAFKHIEEAAKKTAEVLFKFFEGFVEKAAEIQTEEFPLTQMLRDNGAVAKEVLEGMNSLWQEVGVISNEAMARAARSLLLMNVPAENVIARLIELGKIAVATGEDIDQVAGAYQRVRQAIERETAPAVRGVGAFGLSTLAIFQALEEHFGKLAGTARISEGQMVAMFQGGKVSLDDLNKALRESAQEGGRFFDVFELKKMTFDGAVMAMKTAWAGFQVQIGTPIIDTLTPIIQRITDVANALKKLAEDVGWRDALRVAWALLMDEIVLLSYTALVKIANLFVDMLEKTFLAIGIIGTEFLKDLKKFGIEAAFKDLGTIASVAFGEALAEALGMNLPPALERRKDTILGALQTILNDLRATLSGGVGLPPESTEETHRADTAKQLSAALHELEAAMNKVREQQNIISGAPFMGIDDKQVALLNTTVSEMEKLQQVIAKLQTLKSILPLNDPQLAELNVRIQAAEARFTSLGTKLLGLTQPLKAELQNWANSFGTVSQQIGKTIEGTIGVALQSVNQFLVTGKFNAQQLLQQIILLGLQLVEQLIIQRVMGAINSSAAAAQAAILGPAITAAMTPAATAMTIATQGEAAAQAPISISTALALIRAILGVGVAHTGGAISRAMRRFHDGGLAADEVPIIAQEGEIMIQRSVAQSPGMAEFLLGLNQGFFHSGGRVRRLHKGGGEFHPEFSQGSFDPFFNVFPGPTLPPHWATEPRRQFQDIVDNPTANRLLNLLTPTITTGTIAGFGPVAPGLSPTFWVNYPGVGQVPMAVPAGGWIDPSLVKNIGISRHTAPKVTSHGGGLIGRMHSGGAVGGAGGGIHIYAFTDLKALTRHMGSKDGQKIIFDTVKGRRIDLGIS